MVYERLLSQNLLRYWSGISELVLVWSPYDFCCQHGFVWTCGHQDFVWNCCHLGWINVLLQYSNTKFSRWNVCCVSLHLGLDLFPSGVHMLTLFSLLAWLHVDCVYLTKRTGVGQRWARYWRSDSRSLDRCEEFLHQTAFKRKEIQLHEIQTIHN